MLIIYFSIVFSNVFNERDHDYHSMVHLKIIKIAYICIYIMQKVRRNTYKIKQFTGFKKCILNK